MTVKALYNATSLIGPICLSYNRKDVFGYDTTDERTYSTAKDLEYDLQYIGAYRITHIQALRGMLTLTIIDP